MPYSKLRPQSVSEGAGARIRRLFPSPQRENIDPFVLFDEFEIAAGTGFPDHPHRGFEVITYVLAGAMHHRDDHGNDSVVSAGGVQHFSAGRGIVHSEMPEGDTTTRGIQLWVNLPRSDKGTEPAYQPIAATQIPETKFDGYRVRTVAGPGSPLSAHTPLVYLDIELAPGSEHTAQVPAGFTGVLYVLEGEVQSNDTAAQEGEAMAIGEGNVHVSTGPGARYLVIAGRPIGEPIHQHGPYVD
jgi:redox-sensitive bicupin YhaK (pirin superfamily)